MTLSLGLFPKYDNSIIFDKLGLVFDIIVLIVHNFSHSLDGKSKKKKNTIVFVEDFGEAKIASCWIANEIKTQ